MLWSLWLLALHFSKDSWNFMLMGIMVSNFCFCCCYFVIKFTDQFKLIQSCLIKIKIEFCYGKNCLIIFKPSPPPPINVLGLCKETRNQKKKEKNRAMFSKKLGHSSQSFCSTERDWTIRGASPRRQVWIIFLHDFLVENSIREKSVWSKLKKGWPTLFAKWMIFEIFKL